MANTPNQPKIVFRCSVLPVFSSGKDYSGPLFVIYDNGNIGFGNSKVFTLNLASFKLKHEIPNNDISQIETSTSPTGKPETTIKIVDINGRTDIFRIVQFMSVRKDIAAANLPPILSTFFKERYIKH